MRNAAVYILIRFVSQGAVFIATLLIARLLPIEAFAAIGAALLVQALLLPLSGLALHGSLERFYFGYSDELRPGKVFTIWVVSLSANLIIALIALSALYALQVNFLTAWQAGAILGATVLQSAQYVPSVVMRCREQMKVFAAMQFAFIVLTQATVVIWVASAKTVDAWFSGTLVGSGAAFLMWSVWMVAATKGRRLVTIRDEFRYALPSLPVGILEAVQQTMDRYVLQATVPPTQFATYSLGQRFASPIATLASGAKSAIYPILYRSKTPDEAKQMLTSATNVSVAMFGALVALSAVAMAVVIQFFLADEYAPVFPFFIIVAAGLFIRGQEVLLGVGPDITLQQGQKLKTLAPILLVQIAVAAALTLAFGLWGAALAFLANSIIRTGAMAALGQRLLPRRIGKVWFAIASFAPILALFIICMGALDSRPVGPELSAVIAPLGVLAYLLMRKGG